MADEPDPKPGVQTSSFMTLVAGVIAMLYQGIETKDVSVQTTTIWAITIMVCAYMAARAARALKK